MAPHTHASSSLLLRHRPRLIRPPLPLRPRLPTRYLPLNSFASRRPFVSLSLVPCSSCFAFFCVFPRSFFSRQVGCSIALSLGDSRLWECVMSCTDDPFELYFALFGALWLLFRLFPLFFSILLQPPLGSLARSLAPGDFSIVGMWNELYG